MSNLHSLILYATPEHECSYLPDKMATTIFVDPKAPITNEVYNQLSHLGFRRSGQHYYRPKCKACDACIPVRIPVSRFQPSKAQKRVLSKNKAVTAKAIKPYFYEEHYQLYDKYISQRHVDGDMYPPSRDQYFSFLVEAHPETQFVEFRIEEKLYGIAVVDQLSDGLSAIYTFFDPDMEKLSPGTFAILWQIQEAHRRELPFLYLGYWISGCRKMEYKSQFRPYQALIDDEWTEESSPT